MLSTVLFAQQTDKKWDKVIAFENDGKIKSANEIVAKIYKKAVTEKDEVQMIKCFFYQSKYLQVVDENAQTKILNNLKTDIDRVSIPSKAILNLVYAKCLSDYKHYDDYTIIVDSAAVMADDVSEKNNTTETSVSETSNYSKSEKEIDILFKKTLENVTILKTTPLTNYKVIFDYLSLEKLNSQNLFEYLLKENIEHYTEKIHQWTIEKSNFQPYKKELLGSPDLFLKFNLNLVKDEDLRTVLSLYQTQEKNYPTGENQLERMIFCKTYLFLEQEDFELFSNALNTLQKTSTNTFLIQKIQLEKANILVELANKETKSDYNIKALITIDSILQTKNDSNSYKLALGLKKQITSKSINISLQKYSYDDENTRALIEYKNVEKLKVSFFKIDQKQLSEFKNVGSLRDSLVGLFIEKSHPIKTESYLLKDKKDYFEYSTEILLPNLKTGTYLVYFESDSEIKNENAFAYETITISNITALATQDKSSEIFQVLDRKTGKPLENVTIKSQRFTIKTDKNGVASYEKAPGYNYYESIELSTTNDTIVIDKPYVAYNNIYDINENKNSKSKVEFYLDRAIYRPGQNMFYKGIAIQKDKNKTTVVANTNFKITIKDNNYTVLKEFEVTTNEFGSFSGEFILPKTGLTGQFTITADKPKDLDKIDTYFKQEPKNLFWQTANLESSQTYFSVEEYKRPKFEVTFEPKKETYQVNQSIQIKGIAKAFAGSNISDAKVLYTITRFTNYYRGYYNEDQSEILTTGETKTDASGKFVIDFVAQPAKNAQKSQLPIFNYRISTSVTDINGETHDAQTSIKIGFHDLALNAVVDKEIQTKNKNEVQLTSYNLNGESRTVKGEVKIYFINPVSNKFKNRIWQRPEIESISDQDFEKLFPFESNKKETLDKSLTGILVFSKKIDTQKDKKILLDFISNYKSGDYRIVFSAKDSFDNLIESESLFKIVQSKDKFNPSKLFTAEQINEDPKKDGFVLVKISSVIPDLYIVTTGNYEAKSFYEEIIPLQNNEIIIKIPLKNEFEKSIKISFQSVFENETFTDQIETILKTEIPKLDLKIESFRSKIQPGSLENWSFQLNAINTKKEAEILASMYDSSLDQFSKKDWESLAFRESNYYRSNFKTDLGFQTINMSVNNLNEILPLVKLSTENSQLKWFGFNFNRELQTFGKDDRTIYELKDKKNGSEYIRGDPDAVLTLSESIENRAAGVVMGDNNISSSPPPKVDQVRFVKPVVANAVQYFQTNKAKFVPGIKIIRGSASLSLNGSVLYIIDSKIATEETFNNLNPADILSAEVLKADKATALYGSKGANGVIIVTTKKALEALTQVKARKNLSETAFFLPNLRTDEKGKISFNFTSPEALTAWKLRLLAHNKDAVSGYLEKSVVTQKELMLLPNFPRFLREKDTIVISAKISNVTNEAKTGIAILQFFDATTMQPIDAKILNAKNVKNFTVGAFGNTTATWTISIPEGLQGVQYKILAKSGNYSDGEENILPVLTNSMLVTESIPIWVRENSTKEYTFENLKNNTSTTLKNHQFTLEYTSNPSWIAIQSLPYLMDYEHECAEQTFARFYANALASEIISSNPKIATVFETWRKNEKLNSKLEENEELKSIILAETPWLNDAQTEDEKKKNLALLFDLEKMKTSQEATFQKLKQKQQSSGSFSWFDGSNESEYITRHILAGLGHLSKLNKTTENAERIDAIAKTGIPFLDRKFQEHYSNQNKDAKATGKLIWINPYSELHYLYTRSFYLEKYPLSDTLKKATKLYLETAKKEWLKYSLYEKGLAALTLNRFGESETAKKIIESLKETASNNEDWGMYWIANKAGWYWYQAPIETQALLIEAFAEVNQDTKSVDAMKVWLLKNKQTKNWPTTKSTTEAVYALLMQGTDWLSVKDNTIIKIGNEKILTKKLAENEKEAETGYIKMNWKADEIKKEMASIKIENKSKVPGFGGVYWQYFEDLDKIKNNSGAVLSVAKELYLKKNTIKGNELEKITSKKTLQTGDLVTVRLIITSKEDMEFVHLKDMRASCFEPVNVLSEYQYKDRLGYYMSTKDAATHFFFDQINKGTYVIEYDIRVNNSGEFSNGITTIESMYAPEFSSHTKGIRVKVQ